MTNSKSQFKTTVLEMAVDSLSDLDEQKRCELIAEWVLEYKIIDGIKFNKKLGVADIAAVLVEERIIIETVNDDDSDRWGYVDGVDASDQKTLIEELTRAGAVEQALDDVCEIIFDQV